MDWSTIITEQPCEQCGRVVKAADAEINALRGEVKRLERMLADEKQKVANLDEYVLKGVAFRDELQARIKQLEEEYAMAKFVAEDNKEWGLQHEKDKVELKAALARYSEALNDAIDLAQEGWDYVGEDSYFYAKWNVKKRFEDIRRRAGDG